MYKKFILVCLLNFFIAALMGLALRFAFIHPIDINYRFLTHGHSHVAMLGWIYLMLYAFILQFFIPDKKPIYNRLFWLTEFAIIGMMISFPIQGYAVISISFSTLHILCSYYFVRLVFKNNQTKSLATSYLLKASLIFMLISTIGVWCLGPAVSMLGQASTFYQIAIQFFLHFQFNGWFLIAILALFFNVIKVHNLKHFKLLFILLILATVFTFALPISWFIPHLALIWVNAFGVLFQLAALWCFIKIIQPNLKPFFNQTSKITKHLYYFALLCFVFKIGVQSTSLFPKIGALAHEQHNFVIGFIHLTMLGVLSGFLFAFLSQSTFILKMTYFKMGCYLFFIGFLGTELILFIQGYFFYCNLGFLPQYYSILFLCSIFLPMGICGIGFSLLSFKRKQ